MRTPNIVISDHRPGQQGPAAGTEPITTANLDHQHGLSFVSFRHIVGAYFSSGQISTAVEMYLLWNSWAVLCDEAGGT